MKNKIWVHRVFVVGLVIGSCFVIDIHSIERGKRPRSKSSESGRSSRAKEAAATAAATPTPTPAPSSPPVQTSVGGVSKEEMDKFFQAIIVSPQWTDQLEAMKNRYEKDFTEDQRSLIEASKAAKIEQARVLEQLQSQLNMMKRISVGKIQGKTERPENVVVKDRSGWLGYLYDYESTLFGWTKNLSSFQSAILGGLGTAAAGGLALAAAGFMGPVTAGLVTLSNVLGFSASAVLLDKLAYRVKTGEWTEDNAIDVLKSDYRARLTGSSMYCPSYESKIHSLNHDFMNDNKSAASIFNQTIAQLKMQLNKELADESEINKEKEKQINYYIGYLRKNYEDEKGNIDDTLALQILEKDPNLPWSQALVSEYSRAKGRIAQKIANEEKKEMKEELQESGTTQAPQSTQQTTPQPAGAPTEITPAMPGSRYLELGATKAGQPTTNVPAQQTPPPTPAATSVPAETRQASSWIPSFW